MSDSQVQNKSASFISSLLVKSALIILLFFLYTAVMWFWDSQNIITKIAGAFSIILCFISIFMPVKDKDFKYVLISVASLVIIFYASQWLGYAIKT